MTAVSQGSHIGVHGVRALRVEHILQGEAIDQPRFFDTGKSAASLIQQAFVDTAHLHLVGTLARHGFLAHQGIAIEIRTAQSGEAAAAAIVEVLCMDRVVHATRILYLATEENATPARRTTGAARDARLVDVYGLGLPGHDTVPV